ncbi:Rv3235 family protein [Actinokineospora bangkokensis]|uniref:SnoaL-like domain-containing protein n=1 Tax=Actinokineospora bangkokensis TaxID=1193682 RepID=A0A1Q9LEI1_9PSEU|nr:Rv3235 family protein [Actinokineospora bangkokensis]OLR90413.1 hypothetical protein BJP25_27570 [Actinokineospora bangkokensis]
MVWVETLPEYGEVEDAWSTPTPGPVQEVAGLSAEGATPARDAVWRLLALAVEVVDGKRHPGQLRAAVTAGVYESLLTRWREAGPWRHRLVSLHLHPLDQVDGTPAAEFCGTVRVRAQGRPGWHAVALAGRVEAVAGRWVCTAFRLLLPAAALRRAAAA